MNIHLILDVHLSHCLIEEEGKGRRERWKHLVSYQWQAAFIGDFFFFFFKKRDWSRVTGCCYQPAGKKKKKKKHWGSAERCELSYCFLRIMCSCVWVGGMVLTLVGLSVSQRDIKQALVSCNWRKWGWESCVSESWPQHYPSQGTLK